MVNGVQRYFALDVLRGLTIALMILVNNPGSWSNIYAPFKHAVWHGFTITDLIFPTFLFVVGNAMSFSLRKNKYISNKVFLKKILKRSFLIFFIGLSLNAFPFIIRNEFGEIVLKDFSEIRIMGVLQRIAICYLIAGLLLHFIKTQASLIISINILLFYWWVLYRFGNALDPFGLQGNAALKFDLLIFQPENLWKGFGIRFDPEGLLSTLPAVVNVIAGYVAGVFIQTSGNKLTTVWKLALGGLVLLIVSLFWDNYFPINKALWTSSFVLYSIGWDLLIIAVLIIILELWHFKKWAKIFIAFGRNPLFIFVLSGIFSELLSIVWIHGAALKIWIYTNAFLSWLTKYNASLAFAVSFMLLMWCIGYIMDRKKIYIKV
ncbi:Predicted acyltransferase [Gillisia sp. Hel1_33_143]|uniref:acyltransferase family protein n=1 Tax=Gillisia sp. Hel1_33_143 TaxID=1336796 RepID=UPI00087B41DD|nr:heparan-alpha-glucosaminide N-acetyltransferase domain-containing protein [Gillisia sp. Hel1_33_143]SDR86976.1 Predicted acyltransferase [Gillisia sp. Hel1_33_143]